jgi:hypothetical protein
LSSVAVGRYRRGLGVGRAALLFFFPSSVSDRVFDAALRLAEVCRRAVDSLALAVLLLRLDVA